MTFRCALTVLFLAASLHAQTADPQQLQHRVDELQSEVQELKSEIAEIKKLLPAANSAALSSAAPRTSPAASTPPVSQVISSDDRANEIGRAHV